MEGSRTASTASYDQLVGAVRERRCILFAGAGVSMSVGLPSWSQLIDHMRDELGLDATASDAGYQTLAEYYRLRQGSIGALRSWMDRTWTVSEDRVRESTVHRLIVALDFPIVYTTNYDNNLELAYELHQRPFVKIANVRDLARAAGGLPEIVKFHGDFEDDQSLVIAETDYFDRLAFDSPLDMKFRADTLGRTILFVGYSMSDLNIRFLLHRLWRMWRDSGRSETGRLRSCSCRNAIRCGTPSSSNGASAFFRTRKRHRSGPSSPSSTAWFGTSPKSRAENTRQAPARTAPSLPPGAAHFARLDGRSETPYEPDDASAPRSDKRLRRRAVSLSDAQLDRYARHIVLKEIGGEGQRTLLASRVTLVGAGGIGSPAMQYLAAAGVGQLRVIDDDIVSLDNLQRQVLFGTADVGRVKVEAAAEAVRLLDPEIGFEGIARRLDAGNVAELIGNADLVLDGSDNFATRLVVSDHCTRARIPLVSAAIGQFQAQIGTFRGWEPGKPCYRCFVGDAFDADDCDSCSELGVLGAMVGLAGSFAALEAIRQITGFGGDAAGRLHVVDGLKPEMRSLRIAKDPGCKGCADQAGS